MAELREEANKEALRMSTVLLAFAASAIGFGIHEVSDWPLGWSVAPAAAAAIAWGISFYAGIRYSNAVQRAMHFNIVLHESQHSARLGKARKEFKAAQRSTGRAYRLQHWCLLAGAAFYIVAVGVHMAENARAMPPAVAAAKR